MAIYDEITSIERNSIPVMIKLDGSSQTGLRWTDKAHYKQCGKPAGKVIDGKLVVKMHKLNLRGSDVIKLLEMINLEKKERAAYMLMFLVVDPASPSGLRWSDNAPHSQRGKVAGNHQHGCGWFIMVMGKTYKCLDVIRAIKASNSKGAN
ncbi:MAG: hypothetical protein ACRDCI_11950 [Plesiomonas shigelloides]